MTNNLIINQFCDQQGSNNKEQLTNMVRVYVAGHNKIQVKMIVN